MKHQIDDEIAELNNKLRTEILTSSVNINTYIKKREELLSLRNNIQNTDTIKNIPCSNISLPLPPKYGGTGLSSLGTYTVINGGTGHSSIPVNSILIGRDTEIPYIQVLNGVIATTKSQQLLANKMIDCNYNTLTNIDISKTYLQNKLNINNGGLSEYKYIPDIIPTVSFIVSNNMNIQFINENYSTIINWNINLDTCNNFNKNNGLFKAPYKGYYVFIWSIGYNCDIDNNNFIKTKLITPLNNYHSTTNTTNNIVIATGSTIVLLEKDDIVYLQCFVNKNNNKYSILNDPELTWFSGELLSTNYVL